MEKRTRASHRSPWVIWLPAALFIFYQFALQVFPSAALQHLEKTFNANVVQISNVSSLFYYSFAGSLLPIGFLMDRFSIRKMLTCCVLFCAIGSFIFAWSSSLFMAGIGRALMGVGGASAFVGTLKLVSVWFPLNRKGLVSGLTVGSAMVGAIMGQSVIVEFIDLIGWRMSLVCMGIIGLALAFLVFYFVEDPSSGSGEIKKTNFKEDILLVLGNLENWKLAVYAGLIYIPLPVFAGLWAMPYFKNVYDIQNTEGAFLCGFVWLGMAVGSPLLGLLSDKLNNHIFTMKICAFFVFSLAIFAFYGRSVNTMSLGISLFFLGFFCGAYSLVFSTLRSINPTKVSGISVSFAMVIVMTIVAVVTQLVGVFLHFTSKNIGIVYSASEYKSAILIIPILLLISTTVAIFFKKNTLEQGG